MARRVAVTATFAASLGHGVEQFGEGGIVGKRRLHILKERCIPREIRAEHHMARAFAEHRYHAST